MLAARLQLGRTLTAAGVLLLAGVAGKSAQFPLHTWLPDAMAGPTPISALIHAATMVAAGVYVVSRLYPLFDAPAALAVLGVMAAITMLLGALRRDRPGRHQAGAGLVDGLPDRLHDRRARRRRPGAAALFHLLTHAAFKALLFLARRRGDPRGRHQPDVADGRAAPADAGHLL